MLLSRFVVALVLLANRRAKAEVQGRELKDKSEIDVLSSKKHYVISLSKKETPPSTHQPFESVELVDSSLRQLCLDIPIAADSLLNVPRRPGEIIWASARESVKKQQVDQALESNQVISCLPLNSIGLVDILSESELQKVLSYIQQNGSSNCPICHQTLTIEKNTPPQKFTEGSKIIFAVSAKMLLERDNLSYEIAKDIYDFKRAIVDNKVIRIDSTTQKVDWFIVSTLSLSEFEEYESYANDEIKKFGEWSVFELNTDKLKLSYSKISGNYCEKCKSFFDKPKFIYSVGDQIKATIFNDELYVDDFNFLIEILGPSTKVSLLYMQGEFLSFVYNYNRYLAKKTNNTTYQAVVNASWVQFKDLFFPQIDKIKAPNASFQNCQNLKIEIDKNWISKLIEVSRSSRLWEFFGIEKTLVTLIKSTSAFKALDKKVAKIENLAQILSVIPNTQDIQIFNLSLYDILNLQIDSLHKLLVEDSTINNGLYVLIGIGVGPLRLADNLHTLMSTELQRLVFLQTIYGERRRKTNRVYLLEKEHISDLGFTSFEHFQSSIRHLLTSFQKAFIVSPMHGKTGSKNKTSNPEVYYEFSI